MFFNRFPLTDYVIDNASFQIDDIFRRVAPNEKLNEQTVLEPYAVRDGQTPETLSFDYYGFTRYYWTILLANNIINPYDEWVKDSTDLYAYALDKYGSAERLRDPHHYVFADTDVQVDYSQGQVDGGFVIPVTNYEYEVAENEKKRIIKLVKKEYIETFARQFNTLVALGDPGLARRF